MAVKTKAKSHKYDPLLLRSLIHEEYFNAHFELEVYKTHKDMIKAIQAFNRKNDILENVDDYRGIFFGFKSEEWERTVEDKEITVYGKVLLNAEDVDISIIAHECFHAAVSNMRDVIRYNGFFTSFHEGNDPEEKMAYMIDTYVDQVVKLLREAGVEL
jgi:hypothetical protein